MSTPKLGCRETFERLDLYVDRELTAGELADVERHLEMCATCAGEFAVEARILDEIRQKLRRVRAPADLLARIAERLRRE